jgi:hypothetical protein
MSNQLPETNPFVEIPLGGDVIGCYAAVHSYPLMEAAYRAGFAFEKILQHHTKTRGTYRWEAYVTIAKPSTRWQDDYSAVHKLIENMFAASNDMTIQHLRNASVDTWRVQWFTYAPRS